MVVNYRSSFVFGLSRNLISGKQARASAQFLCRRVWDADEDRGEAQEARKWRSARRLSENVKCLWTENGQGYKTRA